MGFQRQLCEFEKLLNLKKSYASPNRVDKMTVRLVGSFNGGGTKVSANKDEDVVKSLTQSIIRGPAAN